MGARAKWRHSICQHLASLEHMLCFVPFDIYRRLVTTCFQFVRLTLLTMTFHFMEFDRYARSGGLEAWIVMEFDRYSRFGGLEARNFMEFARYARFGGLEAWIFLEFDRFSWLFIVFHSFSLNCISKNWISKNWAFSAIYWAFSAIPIYWECNGVLGYSDLLGMGVLGYSDLLGLGVPDEWLLDLP